MSRGVALLLSEVLEAIHLVEQYTDGLSFAAFSASMEKQDAVVRRLAVIGEAVTYRTISGRGTPTYRGEISPAHATS